MGRQEEVERRERVRVCNHSLLPTGCWSSRVNLVQLSSSAQLLPRVMSHTTQGLILEQDVRQGCTLVEGFRVINLHHTKGGEEL